MSDECLATNLDATNNSAIIPVSIEVEVAMDRQVPIYLPLDHLLLVSCHGSSWPSMIADYVEAVMRGPEALRVRVIERKVSVRHRQAWPG